MLRSARIVRPSDGTVDPVSLMSQMQTGNTWNGVGDQCPIRSTPSLKHQNLRLLTMVMHVWSCLCSALTSQAWCHRSLDNIGVCAYFLFHGFDLSSWMSRQSFSDEVSPLWWKDMLDCLSSECCSVRTDKYPRTLVNHVWAWYVWTVFWLLDSKQLVAHLTLEHSSLAANLARSSVMSEVWHMPSAITIATPQKTEKGQR